MLIEIVVGLVVTLVGGLILYYVFGVGRPKKADRSRGVGILNEGTNTTLVGNTFEGFEVGIEDHGSGTQARDNKFKR